MPDQLTVEQFAQKVRTKYPGAYDSLSDADLTQKVIAKYPEYQSQVSMAQPSATSRFLSNAGDEIGNMAKSAWNLVKPPTSIPEAMEKLNLGYVPEKLFVQPTIQKAQSAYQAFKQGDPIKGTLGAVAALNPLAPDVTKTYEQSMSGDTAGAAGHGAVQVAGLLAGSEAARGAAGKLIPSNMLRAKATEIGQNMYQSSLKPSFAKSAPAPAKLVQTGLTNEIPISKAGIEKIGNLIDDLQQKVTDTVQSNPSAKIDPNKVALRADDIKPRFANQVNASGDVAAIEASKQQFLREQGAKPGTPAQPSGVLDAYGNPVMTAGTPATPAKPMSAVDAQAMKVGTYQQLKSKAYTDGMKSAEVEAQKALARGIKEELVTSFPELKGFNAQEGSLLELEPAIERAVNRIGNHQVIGIGTPIATGAAKAVTGSTAVAAVTGAVKAIVDNPGVKSRLAIALWKAGKGSLTLSQAQGRVQSYVGALSLSVPASSALPDDRTKQ